ncbi:hypothetical protein HanRHA438_Chr01g0041291 [Helianthus annuus]|nr:hypothetical protein HanRHA438_Chr01g0041291 [Helianthus annuus]
MFWRRVILHFSKLLGSTERNMDQMTSKWTDLDGKISKFNGCFIQKVRFFYKVKTIFFNFKNRILFL